MDNSLKQNYYSFEWQTALTALNVRFPGYLMNQLELFSSVYRARGSVGNWMSFPKRRQQEDETQ